MDIAIILALFIFLGVMAAIACARSLPDEESSWALRMMLIALLLRLTSATLFAILPEARLFHEDADGYEGWGMRLAMSWRHEGPPARLNEAIKQNSGFYYFSAAIYYLFGIIRPAVSYANSVIGTVTVFLVYRLARELFHIVVARRAMLLAAVIPSMVLWSSIAIKDSLMVCLILVSLVSCISLRRRFSTGALFGTLLPVVAVLPIRFYMFYILTFAIGISLFLERGTRTLTGFGKQLVFGVGIALMLVVFGFTSRATEGVEYISLSRASTFRAGMATTANSGFAAETDVSTPGRAIAFLPFGVSTLLLAPFPWQMGSLRAALSAPEMIVWWMLVPSLIRGLRFVFRRKLSESLPLLIFAFTLTLAYSLVHGNVGSAFRQRAQIFVILFIFAALGGYVKTCRKNGIDQELLLRGTT